MESQKHLFQLPGGLHYLNCAYMSPLLKSVEEAGIKGIQRKRNPSKISPDDFFNESIELRELVAQLIKANANQIAIIPSTSYGLQNALNNISAKEGGHALTIGDEFPSGYYAIERWCKINQQELKIIDGNKHSRDRAKKWNEELLNSINNETSVVILSSIHWMNGTRFDLET